MRHCKIPQMRSHHDLLEEDKIRHATNFVQRESLLSYE